MIRFGFDDIETMESKDKCICFHLNDDLYKFEKDIVDNFIKRDEFFFYHLLIWHVSFFRDNEPFVLPEKILNRINPDYSEILKFL